MSAELWKSYIVRATTNPFTIIEFRRLKKKWVSEEWGHLGDKNRTLFYTANLCILGGVKMCPQKGQISYVEINRFFISQFSDGSESISLIQKNLGKC